MVATPAAMLTDLLALGGSPAVASARPASDAVVAGASCVAHAYNPYFDSAGRVVADGWVSCSGLNTKITITPQLFKNNGSTFIGWGTSYCLNTSFCEVAKSFPYSGGSFYCTLIDSFVSPANEGPYTKSCGWLSR